MVGVHKQKHVDIIHSLNAKHEVDFFWIFLKNVVSHSTKITLFATACDHSGSCLGFRQMYNNIYFFWTKCSNQFLRF